MACVEKLKELAGKPPFTIKIGEATITEAGVTAATNILLSVLDAQADGFSESIWTDCSKQEYSDFRASVPESVPAIRYRPDAAHPRTYAYLKVVPNPNYKKIEHELVLKRVENLKKVVNNLAADSSFWSWQGKGGSIVTRLSKVFFDGGFKLSPEQLTELGNVLSQNTLRLDNLQVDINNTLDWPLGTYGDPKSCFWGGSRTREFMRANGFLALRVYQNEKGYARCWIGPVLNNRAVVCFNAYGIALPQMGIVLSKVLELPHRTLSSLQSRSDDDNKNVYINSGKGIIVGPKDLIDATSTIKFALQ